MTISQRLSLLWRRFSPLDERLITAVRGVLPPPAQTIFDAQIAGVTHVQRLPPHWLEISFYRRKGGKVGWSDTPRFPRDGEFRLAEVQFSVRSRRYTATLSSIGGHVFDFTIRPSPKAISFAEWDAAASVRLLSDPMRIDSTGELQPIPDAWREFMARCKAEKFGDWKLYGSHTAFRTAFTEGEFLVLAERGGDQFVLHRIDPPLPISFTWTRTTDGPSPSRESLMMYSETSSKRFNKSAAAKGPSPATNLAMSG